MDVLRLKSVTKLFGDFKALDGVDMRVRPASIHAILGENGAGKTTLMNILYGLYQPDGGTITLRGKEVSVPSPREALDMGIGMIHQHFMLVDTLSVVENVVLGLPDLGMTLSLKEHQDRIAKLSEEFGFEVDPRKEIWRLPMGMRQRVEIIKALYRDVDILILDEPTSVLAPTEIDGFLQGLERLRAAGKTVIFITHKLEEVLAVGDRITVLRHGRVTAETEVAKTDAAEMARMMVGRDVVFDIKKPETEFGEILLDARDLNATDNRGLHALRDVSLQIRAGEILGVAGVDGNGQAELAEVLTGLRKADSGKVLVEGRDITDMSVFDRRHKVGLSYVPEDRHSTGLVLDFSVADNVMLRDFTCAPFSKNGIVQSKKVEEIATDWVERYDVRLQSIHQQIRYLSGGNQQKLVFAREVECEPHLLVVMQPCKGLDVGAIEAVQNTILDQKSKGKAVLYISTELEHILSVCDRIAVMCGGRIIGVINAEDATPERIGVLMSGISEEVA